MKCPKDTSSLEHVTVAINPQPDIHIDICKKCQGVWIDKVELAPLISHVSTDENKTYKN